MYKEGMQGGAVGPLPLKLPPAEPQGIITHFLDTGLQIYVWTLKLLSQANMGAVILTDTCDAQMGFLQNGMLRFKQ